MTDACEKHYLSATTVVDGRHSGVLVVHGPESDTWTASSQGLYLTGNKRQKGHNFTVTKRHFQGIMNDKKLTI